MNKYITPLPENEVLACQNDGLNLANRFTQLSLLQTQEHVALFYGV